jgi:hypothetical protein
MPARQQVEIVRFPAAASRPEALAVQGRSKIDIGGHANGAQFIEQEAELRRGRRGGSVHGVDRVQGCAKLRDGCNNMVIAERFFQKSEA